MLLIVFFESWRFWYFEIFQAENGYWGEHGVNDFFQHIYLLVSKRTWLGIIQQDFGQAGRSVYYFWMFKRSVCMSLIIFLGTQLCLFSWINDLFFQFQCQLFLWDVGSFSNKNLCVFSFLIIFELLQEIQGGIECLCLVLFGTYRMNIENYFAHFVYVCVTNCL